MKKVEKIIELEGKKITLTTGHLAARATGAVMASCGETVVLATVVAAPLKQDWGYFPLMVDYRERLYAGGKIKGSRWVKREGRPLEDEILLSRLIDRSIRPLFPENYKKEVFMNRRVFLYISSLFTLSRSFLFGKENLKIMSQNNGTDLIKFEI